MTLAVVVVFAGSVNQWSGVRLSKRLITVDVETPLINFDVNGNAVRENRWKPMLTSKFVVNYQLPKSGKDRVTFSSKMRDLSTRPLSKFDATV